jgi:autophagy-related protein 5
MASSPALAIDRLRAANWSGSIPIILSLAPTSLSSPTIPPPIHVLLSRHTFLHIGLKLAVMRLHKFAPPTISFTRRVVEEPDVGTGSHDEEADEKQNNREENKEEPEKKKIEVEEVYPVCWFEDEATELPLRWQLFAGVLWDIHQTTTSNIDLPWKIRLHFTSYPSSQLLELDSISGVNTTIERTYKNSLKQALVLQHGNNKVALNISKQSHQRVWDSIVTSKYSVYKPIQEDIQAKTNLVMIPIRLLVDSSKPLIQKRCDEQSITLGQLLHQWIPEHFDKAEDCTIQPKLPIIAWRVSGIVPPLSALVLDLWRTLCQPDNFLYIAVVTQ